MPYGKEQLSPAELWLLAARWEFGSGLPEILCAIIKTRSTLDL